MNAKADGELLGDVEEGWLNFKRLSRFVLLLSPTGVWALEFGTFGLCCEKKVLELDPSHSYSISGGKRAHHDGRSVSGLGT